MLRDVVAVRALDGHRLWLRFDDGIEGEIALSDVISFDGVFEPLKSAQQFAAVRVDAELGTVVWPNGADLDPVVLYHRVTGTQLPGATSPVPAETGTVA
jgi:hypothetical protein